MNFDDNYNPYSSYDPDAYIESADNGKNKRKKDKKDRKKTGFFKKAAAYVGAAVLFGGIAEQAQQPL